MHTLCFELILDLVHVRFMMLDANGSIPHTQAQQHHSWATRNTFVIVTAIAIVTAVVIIMLGFFVVRTGPFESKLVQYTQKLQVGQWGCNFFFFAAAPG